MDSDGQSECAPRDGVKVCFFILTRGHGRGGHYGSLKATAEALSSRIDSFIVDIGTRPSPVVQSSSVRSYFVYFNGRNFLSAFRRLREILAAERPGVLHLFDGRVDFFARALALVERLPLLRTKCGGPPPIRFFPRYGDLIVYSREDVAWFAAYPRFRAGRVHLIPNRLAPFECDTTLVAELRARLEADRPVFLRIARFCAHYEKSLVQCITLVERLNRDGVKCQLALVGAVHEADVYERIAARAGEHTHLITDDRFTLDAKAVIDVADAVIGTGRGFMEAASRGKVLLTPLADDEVPLLISRENFDGVFATNFSPRNRVPGHNPKRNYEAIREAVEDAGRRAELEALARDISAAHFDIAAVLDRYMSVYAQARRPRSGWMLELAHGLFVLMRGFRIDPGIASGAESAHAG